MDEAGGLYAKLEERVLARDQVGATQVFYDLVKNGRPRTEVLREIVRIHAPYTHVPYHQRIDNGFVRFVNNDHCLLSARTTSCPAISRRRLSSSQAQTLWYVPTGLDPWNQPRQGAGSLWRPWVQLPDGSLARRSTGRTSP
jgi:hypothetical protein